MSIFSCNLFEEEKLKREEKKKREAWNELSRSILNLIAVITSVIYLITK